MKKFYEKCDAQLLTKCQKFAEKNINSKGDYYVYREALDLYVQLIESLIKSHKEFDDAIKNETNKIIVLENSLEKDMSIVKFNQANYCLYLDVVAHNMIDKLKMIEKENRNI